MKWLAATHLSIDNKYRTIDDRFNNLLECSGAFFDACDALLRRGNRRPRGNACRSK
jgi:hypothetical protein